VSAFEVTFSFDGDAFTTDGRAVEFRFGAGAPFRRRGFSVSVLRAWPTRIAWNGLWRFRFPGHKPAPAAEPGGRKEQNDG